MNGIITTQHITICRLLLKLNGEFIALKAYIKEKRFKNNYLRFCLKKLEKKISKLNHSKKEKKAIIKLSEKLMK